MAKYCDDISCSQFTGSECKLGFIITFRLPKSMSDAVYHNWGYVMPKVCRKRIGKASQSRGRE